MVRTLVYTEPKAMKDRFSRPDGTEQITFTTEGDPELPRRHCSGVARAGRPRLGIYLRNRVLDGRRIATVI